MVRANDDDASRQGDGIDGKWVPRPNRRDEPMPIANDIDEPAIEHFRETLDGQLTGGITRRNALKAGIGVSSGLISSGTVVGTAGATKPSKAESENIIPVHHFLRAKGCPDGDPSDDIPDPFQDPTPPKPDDGDMLVERFQDLPVDDGTDPTVVDGEMGQLTWGQFRDVDGRIRVKCLENGTHVSLHLSGLVPKALYTVWVVVFAEPGFVNDRNLGVALQNMVGFAPLGRNDGSENAFRPSASGEGQVTAIDEPARFPMGNLGPAGSKGDGTNNCLLDHFEVHFVGGYHLDDENQGSKFRPNAVEQFAFIAKDGSLM